MLADADFAKMHTWANTEDHAVLRDWIGFLKAYGVYFSEPLDLDLAMLAALPAAYQATIPAGGGPRMDADKAAKAVLGVKGPGLTLYTGPYKDYSPLFPAYRYHFLAQSKPVTHLAALTHIITSALQANMPAVLGELLAHVAKNLRRD